MTVSETVNSHELDMLETQDIFTHMQTRLVHWFTFATKSLNLNQMYLICRDEWVASGFRDMPEDRGEPWDMFDKEDMSDMFSRAMLEKMQLVGEYITVFLLVLEKVPSEGS